MTESAPGDTVLHRVVRILEAFEAGSASLSVTQIAGRTGLHIATASRLVEQLVGHGLLSRDDDRRVRVGMRLWELGSRAAPTRDLREAAMPVLQDLHAVVGHHAQLGVLDGGEVLFVERLSAPGAVVNYSRVAGRLPLHASSSGLVLLAHAPSQLQEQVLTAPLQIFTDQTIRDARQLRRVLADVRAHGFVHTPGHVHPAAAGVAVPVRDPRGAVVAALSVIVPDDPSAGAAVPALRAAARAITRALGAATPAYEEIPLSILMQ